MKRVPRLYFAVGIVGAVLAASWLSYWLVKDSNAAGNVWHRDRLEICVNVSPELRLTVSEGTARQVVEDGLRDVAAGEQWKAFGLGAYPLSVAEGCPGGFVAGPKREVGGGWSSLVGSAAPVKRPSRFSTMVYIVAASEPSLVGQLFTRAAREVLCVDLERQLSCGEVTTALFLSQAILGRPAELARALEVGLGIDAPQPLPPELHREVK